jgi:mitochondrial import receptor subunit TOM40
MAQASGDTSFINPNNSSKSSTDSPAASFPNTRWMNPTTDLSRNPGIFDDIFKKIKDLMPPVFEGAKLSVTKVLSSHFQVSHSLALNSGASCGYKFGANYVGTQFYSQSDISPVILGDMDANGNSNAQIIHQWTDKLRTRLLAQVQSYKMAGYQLSLDYRTQYTSTSITVANIDLITNSGILVLQHLARVTNNFDVGAEFLYQANPMMPGGHIGITSFATRYRNPDWFAGIKLTPAGVINLGYFHQKTNSPLQLGVEFESSLAAKETSATFSYQYELAKANTTFRGMVDTNGLVTGVIEKRLAPLPFTFILSSSLNHAKAAYRFGFGLLIG